MQRILRVRRWARIAFLVVMLGLLGFAFTTALTNQHENSGESWWASWLLVAVIALAIWTRVKRWIMPPKGWDLAWERAQAAFQNPSPDEPNRARGAAVTFAIAAHNHSLMGAVAQVSGSDVPELLVGALRGFREADFDEHARLLEDALETRQALELDRNDEAALSRAKNLNADWDEHTSWHDLAWLASAFVPTEELLEPEG